MSDLQDRLFDVSDYGGDEPTPVERRASRRKVAIEYPVEPWIEPWVMLRARSGVLPFFHLEASRTPFGAIAAVCGAMGTRITNDMVDQMIRCPECDLGAQLA